MSTLQYLYKSQENLYKNYISFIRILFTLSIYALHRVFVASAGYESIEPFNLIFIFAGFIVFSLDKHIRPVIWFFEIVFSKFGGNRSQFIIAVASILFLLLSFASVALYYVSDALFWPGIGIITICTSVLAGEYNKHDSFPIAQKHFRLILTAFIIYGLFSGFQCYVTDDPANFHIVSFVVLFVIYTFAMERYERKIPSVE
jgi:hypothetical protein